jgi:hypothetical protein
MSEGNVPIDPVRLGEVTFRGPTVDDPEVLLRTPPEIRALLSGANGFILFHGGLHVRGACREPAWHSLRAAWEGSNAFHRLYNSVEVEDVPFAQDCMGDQFLLRDGGVLRLSAETDDIEDLAMTLQGFLDAIPHDAEKFLGFNRKRKLEPGQLFNAYPPFCMKESAGASLKALSAEDVIGWHADLARQIRDLPEGAKINIRVIND